ncbi:carbonic anhydrase, partial [Cladochytrium replicatum]
MAHPTPPEIDRLLSRNREWQRSVVSRNKDFFSTSNQSQKPTYLWIGCADSRVPVNEIFGGIPPGEIFVHRNIANIVHATDLSLLSVLTYAVEHLKVPHIIVAGHYNCGGVKAGMGSSSVDMLDNWLRPVKVLQSIHARDLEGIESTEDRFRILCELNTLASANNIAYTNVVQKAWASGQNLTIRAWVYDLATGLIRDLDF